MTQSQKIGAFSIYQSVHGNICKVEGQFGKTNQMISRVSISRFTSLFVWSIATAPSSVMWQRLGQYIMCSTECGEWLSNFHSGKITLFFFSFCDKYLPLACWLCCVTQQINGSQLSCWKIFQISPQLYNKKRHLCCTRKWPWTYVIDTSSDLNNSRCGSVSSDPR